MLHRVVLFALLFAAATFTVWADADAHGRSVEEVEAEIREHLDIAEGAPIDAEEVPEELMVSLGDAVMDAQIGDAEQHAWMDQMMGGEGSESLDAAHRWMAYRYLTGGYNSASGSGMMGGGMMGQGMMGGGMGNSGWGLMGNPDVDYNDSRYETPEEVLRRRYASGDISRREYRRMLREIE